MKDENFVQLYLVCVPSLNNQIVHCIIDEMHLAQVLGFPAWSRQDCILNSFSYVGLEEVPNSDFYLFSPLSTYIGLLFSRFLAD